MQPGGVNEIVSRFIGHLHIAGESARDRIEFDKFSYRKQPEPDIVRPYKDPEPPKPDLDEMPGTALRMRLRSPGDEIEGGLGPVQKVAAAKAAVLPAF
jgi:hypothetical protein